MTYFPLLLDHTILLPNKTHVGIVFTQVSEELNQLRENFLFCLINTTLNKNDQQQDTKNNAELEQKDEDDLKDLRRDYYTRPKQVY
jgi:hypothetical protein